jgi:apolipoprotein N-acyltransferase
MAEVAAGPRGLFGGFAVAGLELYTELRCYGRWPWKQQPYPGTGKVPEAGPAGYAIAEAVRLFIGAGLAWAALATRQIARPLGVPGAEVAVPTIIAQLAKAVPLTASPEPSGNHYSPSRIPSGPQRVHSKPDLPAIQPGTRAEAAE